MNVQTTTKKEFFSIGWISINLFDHKGYLAHGKKKLFLWQATQNSFLSQCLSDVTGQNPDMDYMRLNVEFMRSTGTLTTAKSAPVLFIYPTREQIMTFVKRFSSNNNSQDECIDVSYALENDNGLLESILAKDALAELSEQEKNVLWRRREDCLNYPHSLPKVSFFIKSFLFIPNFSQKDEFIGFFYNLMTALAISEMVTAS